VHADAGDETRIAKKSFLKLAEADQGTYGS
jgi:hypothetical protein